MHLESLKILWGAVVLFCLLQEEALGSARETPQTGIFHGFLPSHETCVCKACVGECGDLLDREHALVSVAAGGSRCAWTAWKGD